MDADDFFGLAWWCCHWRWQLMVMALENPLGLPEP